ncbi:MAG TPA: aldo/keto reductase [Ktedonobacterales bacterium]|jgi:aryl-alcohol dehydrogenase-like predicted oxidoreductase|nr:aldo/keto reductase [Ktedonobacterales bacterium]
METRPFGKTGMEITPIGFGAWAIGGGNWEFGWGSQDDQQSIAAIHRALDLGINWIDTAAVYGLGHSEEMVARALDGMSQRPYVFTKCSMIWNDQREVGHSLKRDSLRRELEASLRRLRVDAIDLYQIHWPSPDPEIEEGWAALAEFKREGKVRHIGVSNFNVEQLQRAAAIAPVETLQPPYSLLERDVEAEILPYAREHNIGVIVYSPMASGLLTGAMTRERVAAMPQDDWRKHDAEFQEPRLSQNLELVERLRAIGERHGRSPGEVAIAWALHNPAVTAAIVGSRSPEQTEGVIGAGAFRLTDDEVREIEAM